MADVRAMDKVAIEEFGIDGYLLMTRAAQASVDVLADCFPTARSVLVVCGGGNNAGDGYCVARLARERGFAVTVCSLIDPELLRDDAARAWRDYCESGGKITDASAPDPADFDVVVDAILGTGVTRPVTGLFAETIERINRSGAAVLSLDIPSGLNGDTGFSGPVAINADVTVTFVALKTGLFTSAGQAHSGQVFFHDLEIPAAVAARFTPRAYRLHREQVQEALPPRHTAAHKGDFGRVLLVGGGAGMPGAALLAGSAALRSGAGLVKVACHPGNEHIVANRPELMCHALSGPRSLAPLLQWCDVLAIGPGLGRDNWAQELFEQCIDAGLPMVVDADALFFLRSQATRHEQMIITPHTGEAARLLGVSAHVIDEDRFAACRALSERYGGVCVLKGAGTVVCSASSPLFVCDRGNPGMATAGTGDVLTGVVAAVYAQQPDKTRGSLLAAQAGVWVHATAGDRAAAAGMRGMIAGDLLDHLRAVIN